MPHDRRCPTCRAVLRLAADPLGRPVVCESCRTAFTPAVPSAVALPADTPSVDDAGPLVADAVPTVRPVRRPPPDPEPVPKPRIWLALAVLGGMLLAFVIVFAFLVYVIVSGFVDPPS